MTTQSSLRKGAGLELIKIAKTYTDDKRKRPTKIVGGFGVKHRDGFVSKIFWKVSDRKDRRHGIVNMPAPKDEYMEDLYKSMFRKWHNEKEK